MHFRPSDNFFPELRYLSSMKQVPIWACVISLLLLLNAAKSDERQQLRDALLEFIHKLSDNNSISDSISGWNSSSYPCKGKWKGITCDNHLEIKAIVLDNLNFSGVLDAKLLCSIQSLSTSLLVINITRNTIRGENLDDIENCFELTHLLMSSNNFSGNFPKSISTLKNLQTLDVSHNEFSGPLPDTLNTKVFLAQDNQFFGPIPRYNFSNFNEFNVSYNDLSGAIPEEANRFKMNSFIYNPLLCGPPLPKICILEQVGKESEPASPPPKPENNNTSNDQILMFAGYILIAIAILLIILIFLYKKGKKKQERLDSDNKVAAIDDSMMNPSFSTVELKASKNGYSTAESGLASSSLIVLTSPEVNGLRFEDLLEAPADLLGRGKHGSLYKVVCEAQGMILAVKRIKDWTISSDEFKRRMRRLNQVKHRNVLPAIAFYSSRQEKLLVYEYQQNGSLFRLIHAHGNQTSQPLSWTTRLSFAATIANALSFMHEELQQDCIPHGNLKSSNILLDKNMEPCITEYGLMAADNPDHRQENHNSVFKTDVYAFGVILLELLTGQTVLNDGLDLASWVLAVVREEWTVEVFDKNLLREGASEEKLVNLLQVAIRCVNESLEERPSMKQAALAISVIRDDDERSIDVSDLSTTMSLVGI